MAEPIIGRRSELKALARFVEAVHVGGRALLIEGEAGIGKTALLHEGVRAARASGFRVLTARAAPAEAQMAFAAIGDLFTPTLEETLPSLAPVQRRALEIALLLREPEGPPPKYACSESRSSPPSAASLRRGRFSSRSTTCSGLTRARRTSSASCSGD
jgi:AAA ATPase domain